MLEFKYDENQRSLVLPCPACKFEYVHASDMHYVNDGKDGGTKPSFGVQFWCEGCGEVFVLWFDNEKGITTVDWASKGKAVHP